MSVDQTGVAIGQKTPAASDSRPGKGKPVDIEDAPEGGFSLLLSAMSPPVEPLSVEGAVSTPPPVTEQDLKDDASLLIPAPPMNPMDLSSAVEPRLDRGAPTGEGVMIRLDGRVPTGEGVIAQGQFLSAVTSATGGVDKLNKTTGLQGGAATKPFASESLVASAEPTLAAGDLVQPDVANRLDPMAQKLVQARRALGEDIRVEVSNARLEQRAVNAAAELDLGDKNAVQTKLPSSGDFAARLLEPIERPRGKSFGLTGASGAEAGWTQYAHHARTAGDIHSNFNAMLTTPAQMQVADKVSYWVTQGIQNAELKLEGFGADPVEVSILLKGGEAHVGFRSDQPDVRQMLEGALSQLKDSLAREGVVLSGVTVGGSGSDGGGRQQEQRRGPGANRGDGVAQATSEARTPRASTSVGRSLDIFV